jgi:[methyl-Co(III) methanol-specific corrinoid protein]:coenzyme M methyltransferase
MNVPLNELIRKNQKGRRPAFLPGPFLPLTLVRERGLDFNAVLQDTAAMTEAALMSYELGFESTVLPFDMNVEAEILGATIAYHEGFDGNPVYPTITSRPVACAADIIISARLETEGRMPNILNAIRTIKTQASGQGAVGVFMPGPFTLAGQVMEPEVLFVMVLKKPEQAGDILDRLTGFLETIKAAYVAAGVDFILIEEGGAASISPKVFCSLLLPRLNGFLSDKSVPHIIGLSGGSSRFIPFMLSCRPDGISVDLHFDLNEARHEIAESLPLFAECGDHALLAHSTPEIITEMVSNCLAKGATTAVPPADIYPPAKTENIRAFIKAILTYQDTL